MQLQNPQSEIVLFFVTDPVGAGPDCVTKVEAESEGEEEEEEEREETMDQRMTYSAEQGLEDDSLQYRVQGTFSTQHR